jgi:oligoribonuclease NrnB/cAMP/cGMP phosphodiesterase (DHH superfamily)
MARWGLLLTDKVDLIVYHGNCPDGFCAAFLAKQVYPKAELFPAVHGGPQPMCVGRNVLVLDFSWKRDDCLYLAQQAESFAILDHHATAEKELAGLWFAVFDLKCSGAGLTWDTLHPEAPDRPWYVNYVEDRDLWRFWLWKSQPINAYIMALPHTIDAWQALADLPCEDAATKGEAILLHLAHYIEKTIADRQIGRLDDYTVAVVNAPYPNIGEVCSALTDVAEIGMAWYERGDGLWQFSLRSRQDIDVSVIAKKHGGGGHPQAAGFQLPRSEGLALLDRVFDRGPIRTVLEVTIPGISDEKLIKAVLDGIKRGKQRAFLDVIGGSAGKVSIESKQ